MTAYPAVERYLRAKAGLEPPAGTVEDERREQIDRNQARLDALGERMRTARFGPALTRDELAGALSREAAWQSERQFR